MEELAEHTHGSKVLLQLIRPNQSGILPPQELELLRLSQRTRMVPISQLSEAERVRFTL